MSDSPPLILLPGMGADSRMFAGQQQAFPQLEVATWITPELRESLGHYAERMAARLTLRPDCFLGGASFGGVVALEMACLIQSRACFLIGSLRGPEGLPPTYRRLRRFAGLTRYSPAMARWGLWGLGFALGNVCRGVLRQLSDADGRFHSWATRALVDWNPSAGISQLHVCQIHGDRDWLLPSRLTRAEQIIPGAGHLLSLTHPSEVNAFLRSRMEGSGS